MIAVVGESLIDVINGQGIIGGCPLNVARATSRLGASVAYYGKISQDSYGLDILQTLINDCVFFDPALCNDSLKTLCSEAKLDENGKASYVFNYENTCTSNLKKEELVSAFDIANDIDIVFYGSIALLMEPGCDAIVPAIDSIKTKPIRFLDPNVRPFMVKDAQAFKEMILKYASQSEIVKASEEDIAFLYPGISILEAEKQLLD
ncbi:MAG: carbohydrate kinase, partial [Sphaerochaetaceae bacterium]|nr:carbohydrate kinase [Sphaerochaetaceae bacterium]